MDTVSFTTAMARVPSPVTVVTTYGPDGVPYGFTAGSFCSASLDPPLVLVCLDKGASTHPAFSTTRRFLVNVLGRGQQEVAGRFATSGIDRFAAGDMSPQELGLPGLPGASARIACSLHSVLDAGDHTALLGRVEETFTSDRTPLVHVDRLFHHPAPNHPAPTNPAPNRPDPTGRLAGPDSRSQPPMPGRAFPLIFAERVEATAEFYELLGFTRQSRNPPEGEPTYIGLRRGSTELAVVSADWSVTQCGIPPGPGPRFEMFVLVEDLDTTLKQLTDGRVPLLRAPTDMPWGERIAHVLDPDGNPVAVACAITP
ncbi:flavin reductase [Streptomyces sp. NPDC052052]|uniref:flavin reductase n=1 Tax=Streptomyces sp. NPDC052052 TaxID=3154756 RepID=UPI00343137AE